MPARNITKQYLAKTMLELAKTEPFDKITVAGLTQRAGINRKTFYYHFTDKYNLLAWFFISGYQAQPGSDAPGDFWSFYRILVTGMEQHRALYKNILSGRDRDYFEGIFKRFLRQNMETYISAEHLQSIVADKYDECMDFLCATFTASLVEWITNWPRLSVEDFLRVSQFDKIL